METPMEEMVAAQWYCFHQWLRFMCVGLDVVRHLQKRQTACWGERYGMRLRDAIPGGADWFDCYGKRGHDIDIERV